MVNTVRLRKMTTRPDVYQIMVNDRYIGLDLEPASALERKVFRERWDIVNNDRQRPGDGWVASVKTKRHACLLVAIIGSAYLKGTAP